MIKAGPDTNSIKKSRGIRMMDLLISTALLFCSLPISAFIAALIMIFDGRPVFFKQVRTGLGMKDITIIKFRTMMVGSERFENCRIQFLNEPNIQTEKDDRVTKVGKILRHLSLDELPQLFLVLRGKMSLVGPRPLIKAEVEKLPSKYLLRFQVTPGITGLAQVSGRGRLSIWNILDLDLQWTDNYSVKLYIQILWKTLFAIFRTKEAL
jgi:lipopolysaccharide/colanic/teichoic acid biosynthesis glycosyltransferase